jgi:hypothetical protein
MMLNGKKGGAAPPLFPPWGDEREWEEACRSVQYLRQRYSQGMKEIADLALAVRRGLERLAADMEALCLRTCRFCPSPCCLSARPYFDVADLLTQAFGDIPLPPHQTLLWRQSVCRFSGPRGCRLERIRRPWICTWYRCPVQQKRLATESGDLSAAIAATAETRKRLERAFIRRTCAAGGP